MIFMARITDIDRTNVNLIEKDSKPNVMYCKMCENATYFEPGIVIHHKGYNCVCRDCIRSMTDIFELSESDLEDIITNAGRHLAEGIEQ